MNTIIFDYVVIGSGIAGLTSARQLSLSGKTCLISKGRFTESATLYAQGGIAAAMCGDDTPAFHFEDTIRAGDGLCDEAAVRVLVEEGPLRVSELIELGAQFDRVNGALDFGQEAAHGRRRILHAGDATGREIEKTLGNALQREGQVTLFPNTMVLELNVVDGVCVGCVANGPDGLVQLYAKAVVLATGGCGQLFSRNTNPAVATGDGLALAYRVGCEVQDMEFIQFHPTTLSLGDQKPISMFLISEAVRGEGAVLRTVSGERFMPKYHPSAELAPRDVVARAIVSELKLTNSDHVYLDLTQLSLDVATRFPTIYSRCLEAGIDISKDFIPVSPAAHYMMGGVKTDLWGHTNVDRLYAVGEVACLGVHGANRLASNSLLDGLVFGYRAAVDALKWLTTTAPVALPSDRQWIQVSPEKRDEIMMLKQSLRDKMWLDAGILRDRDGLLDLQQFLDTFSETLLSISSVDRDVCEVQNMAVVAGLIVRAALAREESRGSHYRVDFPTKNDAVWQRHVAF